MRRQHVAGLVESLRQTWCWTNLCQFVEKVIFVLGLKVECKLLVYIKLIPIQELCLRGVGTIAQRLVSWSRNPQAAGSEKDIRCKTAKSFVQIHSLRKGSSRNKNNSSKVYMFIVSLNVFFLHIYNFTCCVKMQTLIGFFLDCCIIKKTTA